MESKLMNNLVVFLTYDPGDPDLEDIYKEHPDYVKTIGLETRYNDFLTEFFAMSDTFRASRGTLTFHYNLTSRTTLKMECSIKDSQLHIIIKNATNHFDEVSDLDLTQPYDKVIASVLTDILSFFLETKYKMPNLDLGPPALGPQRKSYTLHSTTVVPDTHTPGVEIEVLKKLVTLLSKGDGDQEFTLQSSLSPDTSRILDDVTKRIKFIEIKEDTHYGTTIRCQLNNRANYLICYITVWGDVGTIILKEFTAINNRMMSEKEAHLNLASDTLFQTAAEFLVAELHSHIFPTFGNQLHWEVMNKLLDVMIAQIPFH